jgi:hypothetical protein
MYRVDVYKSVRSKKVDENGKPIFEKKKIGSHWYPTEKQAQTVSDMLYRMPFGTYTYIPREGTKPISRNLGGYITSKPIKDDRF